MTDDLETRRRRALYRAQHRGTKEMDHLLGRYAEARLPAMSDSELDAFERLIVLPDPDLNGWIFAPATMGGSEFVALIGAIRRFHGLETGTA